MPLKFEIKLTLMKLIKWAFFDIEKQLAYDLGDKARDQPNFK